MSTGILGSLIQDRVSTDGGTTWKTIVCSQSSTLSNTSSITEEKTKTCGTRIAVSLDAVKASGSGLSDGDLAGTEVSYKDLQGWLLAKTLINYERKNLVSGSVAESEIEYTTFTGYVTSVVSNSAEEGSASFDWEITSSGTIDVTP